jgi:hypothetical protein
MSIANRFRKITSTNTPVPARAHGGPGAVGVEFDTAVNGLVLAQANPIAEATTVVLPGTFSVTSHLNSTQAATADNYGVFYIAPYPVEVVSVRERHETAGSDGSAVTLMVAKVPSGTAKGSGTDVLSAGINLKGTADTNAAGSLHATAANYRLAAGDALALVPTGTLTAVDGVTVTVELKRRTV